MAAYDLAHVVEALALSRTLAPLSGRVRGLGELPTYRRAGARHRRAVPLAPPPRASWSAPTRSDLRLEFARFAVRALREVLRGRRSPCGGRRSRAGRVVSLAGSGRFERAADASLCWASAVE